MPEAILAEWSKLVWPKYNHVIHVSIYHVHFSHYFSYAD